jgi:PAS domain S-box-containing protein
LSTRLSPDSAAAFLAAIVESSDDAIIGKSLDSTVLTWNSGAERLFGWRAEEIAGRSIRILIPDDRQAEEDRILAIVRSGDQVPTFETVRRRKDGTLVSVAITVSPVRNERGEIVAASKIARDISGAKLIRAELEASELRFRMLADNISQLAWITDRTGWITWYNQRWYDYTGVTPEASRGWGWEAVQHPDHVEAVTRRWQHHLANELPWEDTFPLLGADGGYRWFLSRATPSRDASGRVAHWFGTNTDITAMRDAEQRIELLMMEVNHRSKNLLAVIQALARRTAAQGGDFAAKLEARIQAIAANQDVLVQRSWSNVPVRDMIDAQLRVIGEAGQQVHRSGPEITLSPAAAETIAMAIHELATNAIKYGSLSENDGRVAVTWSSTGEGLDAEFTMTWIESDGPPPPPPSGRGFGSRIIADMPRTKLGAQVVSEYAEGGLHWSLRCPALKVLA